MYPIDRQNPEDGEIGEQQELLSRTQSSREGGHPAPSGTPTGPSSAAPREVLQALTPWVAGLLACALGLVLVGDLRGHPRTTIAILLLAGVFYAVCCLQLHRGWPAWSPVTRGSVLRLVLLVAVLMRALLLLVPPSLSDDIYRYRWDGRVQAAGFNPYREPPDSASLAPLRDSHWESINYPDIRTIYPPLAQWLFRLTYMMSDSLLAFQVTAVLGDLLAIVLLLACLRRWALPAWRLALYAWNPLVVVEFASSGHYDSWTLAAVLAAVLALLARRQLLALLALAAGILLKVWPIVLVPLVVRLRARQALWLVLIVLAAYVPYLGAGPAILQPWIAYTGRWLFNDAGHAVLRWLTGSIPVAKALAAALLLGLLAYLWRRGTDPVRGGYWLLLAAIIMSPTIHPWYLLWPLPLAALALDLGWLLLALLAPVAYWILVGAGPDSNLWIEPLWPRFVEYLPAVGVWIWCAWRSGPAAPPPIHQPLGRLH